MTVRSVIRVTGELAITLGMIMLLFVFYAIYVTDWQSARKQNDATDALEQQWSNPRGTVDRTADGNGIAKIYIPAFGSDYDFTIVEGTSDSDLEIGPGHYPNTALPGEAGNFAVAGHRVGKGSPFNDLGELQSCDALVIETQQTWYVYRVLPFEDEAANWAAGKGAQAKCAGVAPLPAPYIAPGKQIVRPSKVDVIAPVPGSDATLAGGEQQKLITLTTCHPKFSARERMIIHGLLVDEFPKVAGQAPPVLRQG